MTQTTNLKRLSKEQRTHAQQIKLGVRKDGTLNSSPKVRRTSAKPAGE